MCATREQAEAALTQLRVLLADLGLEPKAAKTRIMNLAVGGLGFEFLGFIIGWSAAMGDARVGASYSWPVGSRIRPCITPVTGSGNSPTGRGCRQRGRRSTRTARLAAHAGGR